MILLAILMLLVLTPFGYAYDSLFDADNPADLGTVPASYQPAQDQIANISQWKSVRVQATVSGTVTHFLIKLRGTTGITTAQIGFGVWAGTNNADDVPGSIIAYGVYSSFS